MMGILAGLLLFYGDTAAVSEEVAAIQEAIRTTGGSWTAADNWITALSSEERKMLLGGNEPLPEDISQHDRIFWLEPPDPRAAMSAMDWRNHGGANWMTSVKNQLSCGSCAAFAACGAVETGIRVAASHPTLAIDLSEQHLFSCGGGSCASGWYLHAAMDYFVSPGVPDESCLPYSQSDSNCHQTCPDWQARAVRISGWKWVTQTYADETAIKNALATSPIPCYMQIYQDFYSYSTGVYTYAYGNYEGGHFIVLVGWNDQENSWICKNSWGKQWGESGYFRIQRDQVAIGQWAILPQIEHSSTPTPPPAQAQLYFRMPKSFYYPGDSFYLDAIIDNTGSPQYNAAFFIALNIHNDYWFWPSWVKHPSGVDCLWINMNSGAWYWEVMPTFEWPWIGTSVTDIHFIGVVLDKNASTLLTNIAVVTWGFGY